MKVCWIALSAGFPEPRAARSKVRFHGSSISRTGSALHWFAVESDIHPPGSPDSPQYIRCLLTELCRLTYGQLSMRPLVNLGPL